MRSISIVFIYGKQKTRKGEAWRLAIEGIIRGLRNKKLLPVNGTFRAFDNGDRVTAGVGVDEMLEEAFK